MKRFALLGLLFASMMGALYGCACFNEWEPNDTLGNALVWNQYPYDGREVMGFGTLNRTSDVEDLWIVKPKDGVTGHAQLDFMITDLQDALLGVFVYRCNSDCLTVSDTAPRGLGPQWQYIGAAWTGITTPNPYGYTWPSIDIDPTAYYAVLVSMHPALRCHDASCHDATTSYKIFGHPVP
jgi:hypothetical protein